MADGERRQRVITSTPRISPEEIANRAFGSSFRGYAEHEVRAFLGRVAEELTSAREREEQILRTLDDLEEQLRAPKPLDEQELLEALGEETARLLRAAREASADIRRKAEERSASVMEEAQTEAHRLRTDAAEILAVRSQEAEGVAAEIVGDAEARAAEIRAVNEASSEDQRQRAEEEAIAIVESSRIQGREMLDEARIARERVLTDLGRRRSLLQAQIEELRQGRDRLLDAYRVVKRTFLDATEALSQVEARAAADRAQANAAAPAGQSDVGDIESATAGTGEFDDLSASEATAPSSDLPDVDSLFARLRAGQDPDEAIEPAAGEPEAAEPQAVESSEPEAAEPEAPETEAGEPAIDEPAIGVVEGGVLEEEPPGAESDSREMTEREHEPDPHSEPEGEPAQEGPTAADAWRSRHIAAVEPLTRDLVRQGKRTAQDEQNALLDAVRRYKGRPTAQQVLPDDDTTVSAWTGVLREALDAAYAAGRDAVGAPPESAPESLMREAAEGIAFPLRERLGPAIDDADADEMHGLVERIGARYREWKNQRLERALGDALVVAWTSGVYDGVADGTILRWLPLAEGRCADCDDNALEPTVKGEAFPTGQARPPAHPGCRCLLAPESVVAASGAT